MYCSRPVRWNSDYTIYIAAYSEAFVIHIFVELFRSEFHSDQKKEENTDSRIMHA